MYKWTKRAAAVVYPKIIKKKYFILFYNHYHKYMAIH